MKLSIVTVCYNAAKQLKRTLESVVAQTYQNIEFIVIDGGSTDGTLDLLEQYKQSIAVLVSEADHGAYDAMNKGIQAATGNFIFFLNAGDVFYNCNVVKNVVSKLEMTTADIVYGEVIIDDPQQGYSFLKDHQNVDKKYFLKNTLCHQGIFTRTYLFKEYGLFNDRYKICADYEWLLRVIFKHHVTLRGIDLIISIFEIGGLSSSQEGLLLCQHEREEIQKEYFREVELRIFKLQETNRVMNWSIYRLFKKIYGWNIPHV